MEAVDDAACLQANDHGLVCCMSVQASEPARHLASTIMDALEKEREVMTSRLVSLLSVVLVVGAAACSAPTAKSLSDEAMAAMGGADKVKAIKTVTMKDGA